MTCKTFLTFIAAGLCLLTSTAGAADQEWELISDNYAGIRTDWWSVPALADLDADGDIDMLVGNGSYLAYYRNDGTAAAPSWTLVDSQYEGIFVPGRTGGVANCIAPSLADLDADGDYDLTATACSDKFIYYRNDGTPEVPLWTLATDPLTDPLPESGCSNTTTYADIDADGDLDLFLNSCDYYATFYENTGTATQPVLEYRIGDYFGFATGFIEDYGNYLAFHDLDMDGDLDMLASRGSGELALVRNVGAANAPEWQFETFEYPYFANFPRYYLFPIFVDIDADGLDEVIMGDLDGYLSFYENVTPIVPTIEDVTEEVSELVDSGDIVTSGLGNAFTSSLESVQISLDAGNVNAAAGQIQATINMIAAQSGKGVDATAAAELITAMEAILATL